jgi:prepilin-type N-terminal cleavage/methylation domain-containing protein
LGEIEKNRLERGDGQAHVGLGMKMATTNFKHAGLTLIELVVVIVVIAVLAVLLTPGRPIHKRAYIVVCMSHQKQIDLGLMLFEEDNSGRFPWQVAGTNGGSLEAVSQNQVAPHFQALSNYFPTSMILTNVLLCPTDNKRNAAANISQLRDENVSYFLNQDASKNSSSILGGDRHLKVDDKPVHPGLFICTSNMALGWSSELHSNVFNGPTGGLMFGDGHFKFIPNKEMNDYIQRQPAATNRFDVP